MFFRRLPRLLIAFIFIGLLVGGTLVAIKFAKGYRPSLTNRALEGTGLLAANSIPRGASVFINGKLTTATDDTLNLPPGEYQVSIKQDGYTPWEKTLQVEAELVTQTNARLFPAVPDLKPLTFSGAVNPLPSPDGEKMVFAVENATTDDKNGLYVIDLVNRTFPVNSSPRQITRNTAQFNFSKARLTWSPDGNQILATFSADQANQANLLLNSTSFNDAADLKDTTATLPVLLNEWNLLIDQQLHEKMVELPQLMQQIATASARSVYFSPDDKKMLYTATQSAQIPDNLIPPLPASSTQPQQRQIEPGNIYIYDLEEDKNFWLATAPELDTNALTPLEKLTNRYSPLAVQTVQWYPDSRHVIIVTKDETDPTNKKIIIAEYDGTNRHTVYAGPFADNFAYPSPDGSRLLILASLNGGSNLPPNLYSINLK